MANKRTQKKVKATKPAEPYIKPADRVESAAVYLNHTTQGHPDYNPDETTAQATVSDANWLLLTAIEGKRRLKRNQRALSEASAKKMADEGDAIRKAYRKIAAGMRVNSVAKIPTKKLIADVIAAAVKQGHPARSPQTVEKYLVGLKDSDL